MLETPGHSRHPIDHRDGAPTAEPTRIGTELPDHLMGIWAHPDDEAYLSAKANCSTPR